MTLSPPHRPDSDPEQLRRVPASATPECDTRVRHPSATPERDTPGVDCELTGIALNAQTAFGTKGVGRGAWIFPLSVN